MRSKEIFSIGNAENSAWHMVRTQETLCYYYFQFFLILFYDGRQWKDGTYKPTLALKYFC